LKESSKLSQNFQKNSYICIYWLRA